MWHFLIVSLLHHPRLCSNHGVAMVKWSKAPMIFGSIPSHLNNCSNVDLEKNQQGTLSRSNKFRVSASEIWLSAWYYNYWWVWAKSFFDARAGSDTLGLDHFPTFYPPSVSEKISWGQVKKYSGQRQFGPFLLVLRLISRLNFYTKAFDWNHIVQRNLFNLYNNAKYNQILTPTCLWRWIKMVDHHSKN